MKTTEHNCDLYARRLKLGEKEVSLDSPDSVSRKRIRLRKKSGDACGSVLPRFVCDTWGRNPLRLGAYDVTASLILL